MIQFTYPEFALLFIPWLVLFAWHILRQRDMSRRLKGMGSLRVREFILGRLRFSRQWTKLALSYLGLALLIVAATGPQMGTRLVELKRQGVDVLFVLDTSTSMDATDVRPSRLEKAKYEVGRMMDGLQGNRIGMIVFAGTAHLHFPLTTDFSAARLFLNAVDSRLVQTQGTVLAAALERAVAAFEADTDKFKTVVILSDGEDHDGRAMDLARKAAATGIVIHTVGVGSIEGGPIPVSTGSGFKEDRNGRIVTSILNEVMLEELARIGNGTYVRVDNRGGNLTGLVEAVISMEKRTLTTQEFSQFEDRYQFFIIPALLCFLLEFILPGGRKELPELLRRYA